MPLRLLRGVAAIDDEFGSGDEGGFVGGEVEDCVGDVFGGSESSDGVQCCECGSASIDVTAFGWCSVDETTCLTKSAARTTVRI